MDPKLSGEVSIADLFDQFIDASTMRNVLSIHHRILNYSDLTPCEFNVFFPKLKRAVMMGRVRKNWKAKALFSRIEKKAAHRCYSNTKVPTPVGFRSSDNQNSSYNSQENIDDSISSQSSRTYHNNNALQLYNCLIIGSGPAGLRTAIELQLLGASRVVVVEKRSRFSRNNVLHLWPFVIDDLKSLGAKKFYGKFCAGSIDHISIRQLQLILLKICLMIGCDFRDSCSYLHLCPSSVIQTKKATSETHSDSIQANGTSDSVESITQTCDLDDAKLPSSVDLAKVSCLSNDQAENIPDPKGEPNEAYKPSQDEYSKTESSDTNDMQSPKEDNQPKESDQQETGDSKNLQKNPSIKVNHALLDNKPQSEIKEEENHLQKKGENLRGARAHFQSDHHLQEEELHSYEWDIIIGADGRRNTLSKFFPRKEFRGRLAIAITANFINRQTPAEASVSEISGLSFIYNQDMFNALAYDTNIQLENICYYKDDTHYFVMTAKKKSLLERGVLINDYATTQDLLSDSNVNRQALFKYAKDAAYWTTGLEPLDFALNHYGQEDCAMFDFTSMYAASNACKALRTRDGGLALVSLVGDSLLEPFWPTGSGCARGFLSSFDAAWMCRQWAVNKCAIVDYHHSTSSRSSRTRSSTGSDRNRLSEPTTYNRMALSVMAERESIYRILAQTTSENLQQNYTLWTLNPHTRYPNLNRHLVTPNQVEHLITDNDGKNNSESLTSKSRLKVTRDRVRRVKSPNNSNLRKSPKKLKSANASPSVQPKNIKKRADRLSKNDHKSKSSEVGLDETYLEFEQSYKNLADNEKGAVQYLNYRRPNCDIFDDIFIPSLSGTLPSSNNLLSLEARRARDIDECLRQRRQKTQISAVREQLVGQLRKDCESRPGFGNDIVPGNAALFNELRRLKEQQAKGKENRSRDANGPLSLLNSIRRCASFAERVKSFENKLGSSSQDSSVPNTPKIPIDDVKNLPQFATLQELFVNNSAPGKQNNTVKKAMPIMKLTKDDWNVKCWEKRLALYQQKNSKDLSGSTKSLNKAVSVDSYHSSKPEKQIEVFKDRIKEMSEKLKSSKEVNQKLYGGKQAKTIERSSYLEDTGRSQGWVSHIRRELIKGVESRPQYTNKQPMNPAVPNKPIKKLFEDDDDNDDGIDVNKHYDHLCINRPTNKYLSKNNYTSHLTRVKYNSATSKVVNREPSTASKQAYIAALTSRGSSASSTMSDYSTNTGESSSGCAKQDEIKCSRCKGNVSSADRITIGESILHRICLTCAECGITLRTNEIQHYLEQIKGADLEQESNFICAICKPNIRAELTKEAEDRLNRTGANWPEEGSTNQSRIRSREDFLNEKINYNELYKNILSANMGSSDNRNSSAAKSSSRETTPTISSIQNSVGRKSQSSQDYEDAISKQDSLRLSPKNEHTSIVSPSPTKITLPLKLVINKQNKQDEEQIDGCSGDDGYRIAKSETIDGSEQVTLILPTSSGTSSERRNSADSDPGEMIDEEELQRILHLDNFTNKETSSSVKDAHPKSTSSSMSGDGSSDENNKDEDQPAELSDDSSSLNEPPITDEYDEEEEEDNDNDCNSTYDDFLTSEEFGEAVSDREDNEETQDVRAETRDPFRRESDEQHSSDIPKVSVSSN